MPYIIPVVEIDPALLVQPGQSAGDLRPDEIALILEYRRLRAQGAQAMLVHLGDTPGVREVGKRRALVSERAGGGTERA